MLDNDEQFERYLKQFRPLAPDSLANERPGGSSKSRFGLAAWATAAAVTLIAGWLTMHPRLKQTPSPDTTADLADVEQLTNSQSLTIGRAKGLLAHDPSFKAAIDHAAFQPQTTQLPKGMHSMLAVLSKEKNEL